VKEGANPEMDQIRKLVSGRLKAQVPGPHPDPELLAAFAESALPETERAQLLGHLGACSDCREILYLAMPGSAEAQKVLSFHPKPSSSLVFRWGTLVASVVIVAGLLITIRYKGGVTNYDMRVAAPSSPAPSRIAKQEPPAEIDKLHEELSASREDTKTRSKELPETKHMTAKPSAHFDFDESGQVRISPPPNSNKSSDAMLDQSLKASSENLPIQCRTVTALSAPSSTPEGNQAQAKAEAKEKDVSRDAFAYSPVVVSPQKSVAGGSLGGVVLDPSGAVVGNAKITAIGPSGTKTATSDPDGKFSFAQLSPGLYSVRTEAKGFPIKEDKQVEVLANETSNLRLTLPVGGASETVEVSASAVPMSNAAEVRNMQSLAKSSGSAGKLPARQQAQLKAKKTPAAAPQPVAMASGLSNQVFRWTLSPKGEVERSSDSGKNWQSVPVVNGAVFRALSATGTSIWAGGNAGTLYHSIDTGQTWTQVVPAIGEQKLHSDITHIDFSDPSNGSVTTADGQVWSTSDGGQTWSRK
jgi:hypothetical protein